MLRSALLAVALPMAALLLTRVLGPWMGPRTVLFALAVVAVGLFAGSRAALASAALSLALVAIFVRAPSGAHAYEGYELVSIAAVALIGLLVAGVSAARERAERERWRVQQQLVLAEKMEALGRLAGGIAHDFNNLLTAILGYADVAASRLPPGSEPRADLEEIQRAATRAATLTGQLLAFGRREPVAPIAVDLHALIAEMEAMLRRLIGENIELITICDPDDGRVLADPSQLGQIVMNLVLNARDAMPDGGKLELRTERLALGPRDEALPPGRPAGDYVRLSVADTGVGIPADARGQIFEPFFSTKGEGTGLGLPTVYSIARRSGGFVRVDSELGQGSVFQVYLPHAEEEARAPAPAPARAPVRGRGETVLLVEDDEAVRSFAARTLRAHGYTVIEAANGDDALRLLARQRGAVQLLVTDVLMPRLGGVALVRTATAGRPDIRVLMISGLADEEAVRPRGLPGVRFLAKPFTAAALLGEVRAALDAPPRAEET